MATSVVRRAGARHCLVLRLPGRAIKQDTFIPTGRSVAAFLGRAISKIFVTSNRTVSNLRHPPFGRGGPGKGKHGGEAGLLAAIVGDVVLRITVSEDLGNLGDHAPADNPLRAGLQLRVIA